MGDFSGDVLLADCPARLAIEIIADKWAVVVVFALSRVEYRLTELGQTLVEPIGVLTKWATVNGDAVVAAQAAR